MRFEKVGIAKICSLVSTIFVMSFIGISDARADLHLTIQNNSDATIEVSNTYSIDVAIVTQSAFISSGKKFKLENFLSTGRNKIRITSPCVATSKYVTKNIWISKTALVKHKIELAEKDFGERSVMTDRPNCPE